jgi:hypothetical protein
MNTGLCCVRRAVVPRRRLTLLVLHLLLIAMLAGCGFAHRTSVQTGEPLDATAVSRIVIGKTTRSEVFSAFGAPHSIFNDDVALRSYLGIAAGPSRFEYAETRALTTFSDKHYGMLYRSGAATGVTWAASVAVITVSGSHIRFRTQELLLFLDKDRHVVEEVAYTRAAE